MVSTTPTGQNLENISYTYSSSNTSKVTVNETGIVTGIAAGNSIITIRGTGEDSGKNVETTCTVNVELAPLHVGSIVTYTPTGKYSWEERYATVNGSEVQKLQTIASGYRVDSGYVNASITSWKVFKIENENVQLVPANLQYAGRVNLYGAQGYNNAINLLDEACRSLYSSTGITPRSIDMDDIEWVFNEVGVNVDNDPNILDWITMRDTYTDSESKTRYNRKVSKAYSEQKILNTTYVYRSYPLIYAQEKRSVINGTELSSGLEIGQGVGSKIKRTDSGASYGYKNASISIQPYQTYYSFDKSTFSSLLGNIYSEILSPSFGTNNHDWGYWVASRYVSCRKSYAWFGVRSMDYGNLGRHYNDVVIRSYSI